MSVHINLSTTLRNCVPDYRPTEGLQMDLAGPVNAGELAQKIGLPLSEIKIIMINGRRSEPETMIADGDRIGYFPAVGGG